MADDGKVDRLWDHLNERLNKIEEMLTRDRLKDVIRDAIKESNTLKEYFSRQGK